MTRAMTARRLLVSLGGFMPLAAHAADDVATLKKLQFSYGTLTPDFDAATYEYTLAVADCTGSAMMNLGATLEASRGSEVALVMGDFSDSGGAVLSSLIDANEAGMATGDFAGGDVTVTLTEEEHPGATPVVYTVHVATSLTDSAAKNAACESIDTPKKENAGDVAITCPVPYATLSDGFCRCNEGYVGSLQLHDRTWGGKCIKEPPRGAWPCQGTFPFTCGRCPTCQEAATLLEDVSNSCEFSHIHLNQLVWHTSASSSTSGASFQTVHPDIREKMCLSPICRWRVELAWNSFATCQALARDRWEEEVHWREHTLSLVTAKRIIDVFHGSSKDCHIVRAKQNVYSSLMIQQKFLVTGIDVRSDTTMKQAEVSLRQAFAKILHHPMRRLEVAVMPETCVKDPVCDHNVCGYGECVPWKSREPLEMGVLDGSYASRHPNRVGDYGYRCLCNECFTETITSSGERTCVRDKTCKPKNYCDPNPCNCGGECVSCPECAARGEPGFTCKCKGFFGGPTCDALQCPDGFSGQETDISTDLCQQTCAPRESTNACDPNPCQHGGQCKLGAAGSSTSDASSESAEEDGGYHCECPTSFGGKRCEHLECPDGFQIAPAGDICVPKDTDLPPPLDNECTVCDENPCLNDGYCQVVDAECNYQCSCVAGWTGDLCDTQEDVCADATCASSEACTPSSDAPLGYTCESSRLRRLNFRQLFARSASKSPQKSRRSLESAVSNLQSTWESGGAVPVTRPLVPKAASPPKNEQCTVWQKSQNIRTEVTLTVKCPVGDDPALPLGACQDMLSVLDTKHRYNDWLDLEDWTRANCIALHVNATAEPTEEQLLSNCPSQSAMKSSWNALHSECRLGELGLADWDGSGTEMEVVISDAGVETVDDIYRPLVCGSGICRAMILKYSKLYNTCRNSAPGALGKLARRAKALKNFAMACSNPSGEAVIRQQIQIEGLLDELSQVELQQAEKFLRGKILETVGSSMTDPNQLLVLARPSLDSLNSVNSRVTIPAPEFSPTLLPSDRVGRLAKPCAGLCPVATQPGPDPEASSDPSAHMFITFNHPIKPGPCFTGEYDIFGAAPCMVSLTPAVLPSEKNTFELTKIDAELIFSGETLAVKPKTQLAPFTNYTVLVTAGLAASASSDVVLDKDYVYWFQTGAPRGSLVKVSIALGCYDASECETIAPEMKAFADTPMSTLIDPLAEHIQEFRATVTPLQLAGLAREIEIKTRNALLIAQGLPPVDDDATTPSPQLGDVATGAPLVITTTTTTTVWSLFGGGASDATGVSADADAAPGSSGYFRRMRRLAVDMSDNVKRMLMNQETHVERIPRMNDRGDLRRGLVENLAEQDGRKASLAEKIRRLEEHRGSLGADWHARRLHPSAATHSYPTKRSLQVVVGGSGGSTTPSASGGEPVIEVRGEQLAHWIPPNTWMFYARLVPFVCLLAVIAMAYNGNAVQYWIHDACVANGGYVLANQDVPANLAKQEYCSFLTADLHSLSRLLPPRILWPLMTGTVILLSGFIGYVLCSMTGGTTSGIIGGSMTSLASACVWASFSVGISTWVSPTTIPFFLFHMRPFKTGGRLSLPAYGGFLRPRTGKTTWTPSGPFNAKSAAVGGGHGASASSHGPATGSPLNPSEPLLTPSQKDAFAIENSKHHGSHQDIPGAHAVGYWHAQQEVSMYEDEEHTVVRIPKAPGAGKMHPTRMQDPFLPATSSAENAWLLSVLCVLLSMVLIPLNGIHLYEGQFFCIMIATAAAVAITFFAKGFTDALLKTHCKKAVQHDGAHATAMGSVAGGKKYQVLATSMAHSPQK